MTTRSAADRIDSEAVAALRHASGYVDRVVAHPHLFETPLAALLCVQRELRRMLDVQVKIESEADEAGWGGHV